MLALILSVPSEVPTGQRTATHKPEVAVRRLCDRNALTNSRNVVRDSEVVRAAQIERNDGEQREAILAEEQVFRLLNHLVAGVTMRTLFEGKLHLMCGLPHELVKCGHQPEAREPAEELPVQPPIHLPRTTLRLPVERFVFRDSVHYSCSSPLTNRRSPMLSAFLYQMEPVPFTERMTLIATWNASKALSWLRPS